jgi:ribosomal protein S14
MLPMPVAGEDCLCRDCLRQIAAQPGRKGDSLV